jgi:hypothetical protein
LVILPEGMKANPTVDYEKYQDLIQKEKYLEVINAFATSLIEAETIDEILWTVTEKAIAYLDYFDCVIYLYDEKKKALVQRAAYGPKKTRVIIRYTIRLCSIREKELWEQFFPTVLEKL